MDQMDVDEIVEVPDTPDRLAGLRMNGKNAVVFPRHGEKMFIEEGSREQPMVIDSGSRGLSLHPSKRSNYLKNSQCPNYTSSPSPRNANLYRKGVTERKPSYLNLDSGHKHSELGRPSYTEPSYLNLDSGHKHSELGRPSYTSKSSSFSQDDGILDLTECSLNERDWGKASSSSAVPGNTRAGFHKRSGLPNGTSSSDNMSNLANTSCNGNGEKKSPRRGSLSLAFGERVGVDGTNKKQPEKGILSTNLIAPSRVNKQKRLVRNGCISPNNIAKTKQLAGKDVNNSVAIGHNTGSLAIGHNFGSTASCPPSRPVSINIRELVDEDEDSHSRKGKGVISHPCSSRRPDWETNNLHGIGRSCLSPRKKAVESVDYNSGAGKSIEESVGWRSTHCRTREMNNVPIPDKETHVITETATPRLSIQQLENRFDRRGKGVSVANYDDIPKDRSFLSSEQSSAQSVKESVSRPRARPGRSNGPRFAADTLIKRQKQGSGLSSYGECSTSVADDLEAVLLSSPAETANLRSASSIPNMPQVIEVVESPSQMRRDSHDEDARARQVEADERMALELQEQLYGEMPAFGAQESDVQIARSFQHQGTPDHGHSWGRPQVSEARLMPNLRRQPHSRSSSNAARRGAAARSSALGRMTRLRGRFPGEPRTLSGSQWRTSMFPPDMDVEMRMHILGALEEFNDIGMRPGILHSVTNREFNENDYEMLLALDDDNNHGGASSRQINGLPQSTLQSDLEEACAVCLETPTAGDTIRHLPCFHKFHKDCIDPWLRRRTSCPVCKSSLT